MSPLPVNELPDAQDLAKNSLDTLKSVRTAIPLPVSETSVCDLSDNPGMALQRCGLIGGRRTSIQSGQTSIQSE